jgi:hypothetical protein
MTKTGFPRTVLFDLLTALLDSWSLWDAAAGARQAARAWRGEYLLLGLLAAARLNTRWDCVITAEAAGYY